MCIMLMFNLIRSICSLFPRLREDRNGILFVGISYFSNEDFVLPIINYAKLFRWCLVYSTILSLVIMSDLLSESKIQVLSIGE